MRYKDKYCAYQILMPPKKKKKKNSLFVFVFVFHFFVFSFFCSKKMNRNEKIEKKKTVFKRTKMKKKKNEEIMVRFISHKVVLD